MYIILRFSFCRLGLRFGRGHIYIYIYFGVFLFFMISFSIDIQEKVRP